MIYCNLAGLMANKKVNISGVSRDTKLSRTTLTTLYYNYFKGVQIDTADALCRYFNVGMDKLFIFSKYDFAVSVAHSYGDIFEDQTDKASACVELTVKNGKTETKCEIGIDISMSTYPGSTPVFRYDIKYYDPDEGDVDLEESNLYLTRVFKKLPDEIKPHILEKIVACIEDYFSIEQYVNRETEVSNELW